MFVHQVESGFLDGVQMLLLRKVKVEMADNQGQTAVHLSAGSRHPDAQYIFKLLLESGAVRAGRNPPP